METPWEGLKKICINDPRGLPAPAPWLYTFIWPLFSNILFSETACKAKLHMEVSCEGGMKIYIHCIGHMIEMAAMSIYDKNLQNSSSPEPEVQ